MLLEPTDLIQCNEHPWTRLHRRVHDTDGLIVDLGCLFWDWPKVFLGKRSVVGVDPIEESEPDGTVLYRGLIGPFSGNSVLSDGGAGATSFVEGNNRYRVFTLSEVAPSGQKIAALKINIEGAEWPLLCSWPDQAFDRIDQIAVSFHNHKFPGFRRVTSSIIERLNEWYDSMRIFDECEWWLFVRR